VQQIDRSLALVAAEDSTISFGRDITVLGSYNQPLKTRVLLDPFKH